VHTEDLKDGIDAHIREYRLTIDELHEVFCFAICPLQESYSSAPIQNNLYVPTEELKRPL
jgi:hypothetical protein